MKEKSTVRKIVRIVILLLLLVLVIVGLIFGIKIAPNYANNEITNKVNLVVNYTNVTDRMKHDLFIDNNGVVYLSMDDIQNYYDDNIYYDKEYNQIVTSSEESLAVVGFEEKVIEVNGEKIDSKGSAVVKGGVYYLPISEMQDIYNLKMYKLDNKVVLESLDRKLTTAVTTKKISVKVKATTLSRTIEKLKAGDKVVIVEKDANLVPAGWTKIRTQNGNLGYVELKNINNITVEREDAKPKKYMNEKISLAWEYFSEFAKAPDNTGKTYDGVNVVSPSFFYLKLKNTDKEKPTKVDVISQTKLHANIGNAGEEYIKWAKENGYKVWPKVTNDTLATTIDEFSVLINDYKMREIIIDSILKYVDQYELDGINIDFENMYQEDRDAFTKFIIELAPQMRSRGAVLSVDVTAPDGSATWSLCYDRKKLGEVADYVVFMGYDQYGTNTIGTTSGYGWVDKSINKFLDTKGKEYIPADKIILGLPFYTKLWKTQGDKTIGSNVISLANIDNQIPADAKREWKEELQQDYVEYTKGNITYKIWVEDNDSFAKKLELVNKYKLAGAAYWRKGFDNSSIWKVIKNTLNLN